jgi:2-polyprenyl-6-methoxyphenol hydroxylase-like FAD-dependent oxidoreductase
MTPTAVVVGGSVAGLATALALGDAGYQVEVLERAAPPDGDRHRATVPQARHSHTFTSLGVRLLRERAPDVLTAALAAGATLLDLTAALPAGPDGRTSEVDDDELVALACRRSTFESALYRVVHARRPVSIRHGVTVRGLLLDRSRRCVTGVVTEDGTRVPAGVVVDATGHRAASRSWLAAAGIPVPADLTSPSGLRGFTRFYRLAGPTRPGPLNRGNGAGDIWDHYAGVLHPGDGDTFSIALGVLPDDPAMDALRQPAAFTAAARATPGITPWLVDGVAVPISPVYAITSPPNALRGIATARRPPVAGLFPVGDAACVTNPLFGRGMSLAFAHAFQLADLLAAGPGSAGAAARIAEVLFEPWYEQSVRADQERIARWTAAVDGRPAPELPATDRPTMRDAARAAAADGTVWRGVVRVQMGLSTPAATFADEKFVARIRQAPAPPTDTRPAAPTRAELVRLVAAADGG